MEIKKVNWRNRLKIWGWYAEIQKMISNGDFRIALSGYQNGISKEVGDNFRKLEEVLSKPDKMESFVGWLNYKTDGLNFSVPYDGSDYYWIEIDNKLINFQLQDEYEGQGMIRYGVSIDYIDKEGSDDFWIEVSETLLKAANNHFSNEFEVEEWL